MGLNHTEVSTSMTHKHEIIAELKGKPPGKAPIRALGNFKHNFEGTWRLFANALTRHELLSKNASWPMGNAPNCQNHGL